MDKYQLGVETFMKLAGQNAPASITTLTVSERALRIKLMLEELLEICDSIGVRLLYNNKEILIDNVEFECYSEGQDHVELADGIGDLLYVTYGLAVAAGIDMEPINDEIWANNMSKFDDGYRREDGKWCKGPSYKPVNLSPLIEEQKKRKPIYEQMELNLQY